MAVSNLTSQADQIQTLLDNFQSKLASLPPEHRVELERDLGDIRSCVDGLARTRREEDLAARRRDMEAMLNENEAKYRELAESFTNPLVVFDPQLRLVYRNSAAEQVSQVPNEQAIGKTFEQVYPQLVGSELHAAYTRAITTHQTQTHSNCWVHPADGSLRYYEVKIYPLRDWVFALSEDVTDRVTALEALRKSEAQARQQLAEIEALYATAPIGLCVFDDQLRWVRLNQQLAEMNGVPVEDHIGKTPRDIVPEVGDQAEAALRHILETGQPLLDFEIRGTSPAQPGVERFWRERWVPIKDENGKITRISVAAEEITERKRAEEALHHASETLRESEGRFRAMADGTPMMIWVHQADGSIEFVNRAWTEYFGVTLEDVQKRGWTPLVHPDDIARYVDVFAECLREQKPFRAQTRTMHRSGKWRWIDSQGQPRFSETGVFLGMAGSSFDITERMHVETALLKSEEKFAKAFHSSPVAMSITSFAEGRYIDANEQICQLLGYRREELLGKTTLELGMYRGDTKRNELIQRVRAEGRLINYEMVTRSKSGKDLYALLSFTLVEVNGEECLLTTLMDITEQKQIETERERLTEEIRVQKDLLERLIDYSPMGIAMLKGAEHRFVLANPAQRALFPTVDEFVGYTVAEIWPENTQQVLPVLDQVFRTGEPYHATDAIWRTDKGSGPEETYYSFSYTPLYGVDCKIEGILVLSQETTEQVTMRKQLEAELEDRKQAEAELAKAHIELVNERNLLRAVMEALPVGLAIYDQKGGVVISNPSYEAVWGSPRPKTDSVEDYDLYKAWWVNTGKRVEPEEWASALALSEGQPVIGQYLRIQRFDGSSGYVMNSAAPVRDAAGRIIGGAVAIMDITEQKRLEMEREEAETRMEVQRRLMDQREKERQGIARDIHDGPIQTLASTAFNIQFIRESYPDPSLTVELNQISLNIKSAVRELREVVNNLRPPSIIRFGITRAILMHAEDLRDRYPETEIALDLDEGGVRLSDQACLTLFRVFQEGMNNIFRHAEPTKVWVRYAANGEYFILELRDDGAGFTVPKDYGHLTRGGHFGLAGMKERVEAVGGAFVIKSQPGAGTTITVRGPLLGKNIK